MWSSVSELGEGKGLGMLPEVFGLTWGPDTLRWDCVSSPTRSWAKLMQGLL